MPDPPGTAADGLLAALRASGEVGSALADVDWAATPLGPPEGWETSLRSMVRVVLASRFSMWMAWGPELTFFCNDAYRRDTLASKFPWALGRPAKEVWAEIWEDISPRIESVLRDGEASWDERLLLFLERRGFVEESYHTFSYSPLTGDAGEISGMLCVVAEETERVVDQARLAALREVGTMVGVGQDESAYLDAAFGLLERHDRLVPFSAVYLVDGPGSLSLRGTGGIAPTHPALPHHLGVEPDTADSTPSAWPVARALAGELVLVEDLATRFADLPTGGWEIPPRQAAVVPLPPQLAGEATVGVLIVGLNPYRPFDAGAGSFLELLAAQLAAGVAGARAYVSERRRAEQLAALDAAKTAFFTNVSHELRTPLTLLLAPAEELLGGARERDPGERRSLELIVRNGQRLLGLVNNLLDFSRLQAGQAQARREAVDLSALTRELTAMFESAVAQAGLDFEVDCPPLAGPVAVDPEMWSKIVLNLVSNALKYTLEGSIAVRLRDEDGDGVVLTVSDTGVGIPAADQPLIFDRFHRVSDQPGRTHEGTGIGLALVAELVSLHDGTVAVESRAGGGSTFTVRLPRPPLPAIEPVVTRQPSPLAAAGVLSALPGWPMPTAAVPGPVRTAGDRAYVLVVDDNADMRRYVSGLLEERFDVVTAADGREGLELALEHPPDLVLTDVMMPRLDGFGLLAALRADARTVSVPVVMLSARAGEEGLVEGLEAGADDYLIKPFTARELLARVGANLELDRIRRMRDELERGRELRDRAERLAGVGSWEIDLEHGRATASPEFLALTGLTAEDLARTDYRRLLEVLEAEEVPRVGALLDAAIASGEPFRYETRMADSERWVLVAGEVERAEDGRPTLLRGFMQDITQARAAATAILAAAAATRVAQREHALADEIQRRLLPDGDLSSGSLTAASYYRAGVEGLRAGGDWFDTIDLGAGRTAIVIGDVSGRGVSAASLMGQLRAAIHAYARLGLAPADVLEHLDRLVSALGRGSLVTCFYGIHDRAEACLTYASAGHLPPLARDPAGAVVTALTSPTGPPLGIGSASYRQEQVAFVPDSTLLLYTDGLVERRRVPIDEGLGRLADALLSHDGPLTGLPEALVQALDATAVADDIAILALCPQPVDDRPRADLPLESEPGEVRRGRLFARERLAAWQVDGRLTEAAVTVVSELITNAILHGRSPVRLRLRLDERELVIEVEDGRAVIPLTLAPDVTRASGRGLRIVAGLTARWGVQALQEGKTVWCVMPLAAAAGL